MIKLSFANFQFADFGWGVREEGEVLVRYPGDVRLYLAGFFQCAAAFSCFLLSTNAFSLRSTDMKSQKRKKSFKKTLKFDNTGDESQDRQSRRWKMKKEFPSIHARGGKKVMCGIFEQIQWGILEKESGSWQIQRMGSMEIQSRSSVKCVRIPLSCVQISFVAPPTNRRDIKSSSFPEEMEHEGKRHDYLLWQNITWHWMTSHRSDRWRCRRLPWWWPPPPRYPSNECRIRSKCRHSLSRPYTCWLRPIPMHEPYMKKNTRKMINQSINQAIERLLKTINQSIKREL